MIDEWVEEKYKLLGSLQLFTQTFYKLRTGREFKISEPIGRESHHTIIFKELTKIFRLETPNLLINVPPGHGKSEIMIHFIAWSMAHYPDCQFMYISYSHDLAAKHTYTIKKIMEMPLYKKLFGIELARDSLARDNFKTSAGGSVKAFGSGGAITGQDAGLPNLDRFSGCVLIDDIHKPDEVHSDTIRENVITNYRETISPRPRSANVPIMGIGQRLHERDFFQYLIDGKDGREWKTVVLKSLDAANNPLYPEVFPLSLLNREKEFNTYTFSAQHQQEPSPSGGSIFKSKDIVLWDIRPNILLTFITVDTAETDKNYNDASVFSFWGIYKIRHGENETDLYGLDLIDCREIRVEPKDLQGEFMSFYTECMRFHVKPRHIAIEKKSTGVTLGSALSIFQGLIVINVERTKASGSKTTRFLEIQPYVSAKHISMHRNAKHLDMVCNHLDKITANNTHAHDDIADTLYDAVKIALIDKILIAQISYKNSKSEMARKIVIPFDRINRLRKKAYGSF